jgi:hypothetical protein
MTRQGAAATLSKSIEVSAITTASFTFIRIDTNRRVQPCSYHELVSSKREIMNNHEGIVNIGGTYSA